MHDVIRHTIMIEAVCVDLIALRNLALRVLAAPLTSYHSRKQSLIVC